MKLKTTLLTFIMILFSLFLVGCESAEEKAIKEDEINKVHQTVQGNVYYNIDYDSDTISAAGKSFGYKSTYETYINFVDDKNIILTYHHKTKYSDDLKKQKGVSDRDNEYVYDDYTYSVSYDKKSKKALITIKNSTETLYTLKFNITYDGLSTIGEGNNIYFRLLKQ